MRDTTIATDYINRYGAGDRWFGLLVIVVLPFAFTYVPPAWGMSIAVIGVFFSCRRRSTKVAWSNWSAGPVGGKFVFRDS